MEKIGFVSLGCSKISSIQKSCWASSAIAMEITEDLAQSDIIIVNTCTFIEKQSRNLSTLSCRPPAIKPRVQLQDSS